MKIAVKKANETFYWLLICEKSESYPIDSSLKEKTEELIRIISKIILSSKVKLEARKNDRLHFNFLVYKIKILVTEM